MVASPLETLEIEPKPRQLTIFVNDVADIPPQVGEQIANQYGVRIVTIPTIIRVGNVDHQSTESGIQEVITDARLQGEEIGTSVQPPARIHQDFLEPEITAGRNALLVPISTHFSGFESVFRLAGEEANQAHDEQTEPEVGRAETVPTNSLSFGAGYLALVAARLFKEGKNLAQINEEIAQLRERVVVTAALDNIKSVVKRLPVGMMQSLAILAEKVGVKVAFLVESSTGEAKELTRVPPILGQRKARKASLQVAVSALPDLNNLESLFLTNPQGEEYLLAMLHSEISPGDRELALTLLEKKYPDIHNLRQRILDVPICLALELYLEKGAIGFMAVRKATESSTSA
jgi:fatty acid-binding protein DegV